MRGFELIPLIMCRYPPYTPPHYPPYMQKMSILIEMLKMKLFWKFLAEKLANLEKILYLCKAFEMHCE